MVSLMNTISLALFLSLAPSICAADFHVDVQSGSDATGDGSSQSPWKTITYAVSQLGSGTNRILVHPGRYDGSTGETFPIVLRAGMTLESTGIADDTIVYGDAVHDVFRIEGADADCSVIGLTIQNGQSGASIFIDRAFARILNSTISGNQIAGIRLGLGRTDQRVEISGNKIVENGAGVLDAADAYSVALNSSDNEIRNNVGDGFYFVQNVRLASTRDALQGNGGWGLKQKIDLGGSLRTTISNATISGNQAGGIYTMADQFCIYIPYVGYFCDDPTSFVQAIACTVYGNGGDGALKVGTSGAAAGFLSNSISWGNAGIDNVNFKDVRCDIGTGSRIDAYSFSAPPLLVDPQSGDLRLRKDSPCVDQSPNLAFTDFEGELGGVDGNSDGTAAGDIGADEFHPFVAPGTRAVVGQPFWFFSEAPPADDGQLVFVMISTADGEGSGGIPVPGSQGQTVDLAPDWLFQLGLTVQPALTGTLQNGFAQTATLTLPNSTQFLGPVYYAGATIDLAAGQFKYIMPTHQFSIATQ
ncbi:MAG: DUF1565 domain-containing protein [Planctomycetota bacterium]